MLKKAKTGPLPEGMQWRYLKPLKGELRACISFSLPNVPEPTEEMMRTGFVRHAMSRILRAGRLAAPPAHVATWLPPLLELQLATWLPRKDRARQDRPPSCHPVSVQCPGSGGIELAIRLQ